MSTTTRGVEMVAMPEKLQDRNVQPLPAVYVHITRTFTLELMSDKELRQAALDSAAFTFWRQPEEDVYTLEDGEPV